MNYVQKDKFLLKVARARNDEKRKETIEEFMKRNKVKRITKAEVTRANIDNATRHNSWIK